MPQITEDNGFVRFNAETTLVYNVVKGVVRLSEAEQVRPQFGGGVIESEGQNYAIFVGDGQLQLDMDVQTFALGGHNLSFQRGALSVTVCLEEDDSADFLDALRRKGSGDWLELAGSVQIDLNQADAKVNRRVIVNAMMMGRDDGSTDQMRNMGPSNYQIELVNFPYPLILRGASQNEESYHLDLQMGGLKLMFKLEPGEHRTLLETLGQR